LTPISVVPAWAVQACRDRDGTILFICCRK